MPTLPEQILGHTKQQAQLLSDIAKNNISHAYLFSGPEHIGKSTVARWFSVELLGSTSAPEEKKKVRDQVERLIHPDFIALDQLWVEGVSEDWNEIGKFSNIQQKHRSKAPTAKTDAISIDDVRLLIEELHETAQSPHRVCLITNIERMHTEAANALLKIIEEPPSRVVFLLTTADKDALLPTITSRTRLLSFDPLSHEELQPLLDTDSDDESELLLHLSRGAPGTLLRFQEQPELLRDARKLHTRARAFWNASSLHERLSLCMPAQESRTDADAFLLHLGLALREHVSTEERALWTPHYTHLVESLQTNTNRGLALSSFSLAVSGLA